MARSFQSLLADLEEMVDELDSDKLRILLYIIDEELELRDEGDDGDDEE